MNFERFSRSITHLRGRPPGSEVLSAGIEAELRRQDDGTADAAPPPPGFEAWHPFARMQYFDIKHRMGDGVVLGLDRASMAYSVEARVPFLDHELVEFCARIPPRVKMKWLREKTYPEARDGRRPAADHRQSHKSRLAGADRHLAARRHCRRVRRGERLSGAALRSTRLFRPGQASRRCGSDIARAARISARSSRSCWGAGVARPFPASASGAARAP